MSRMRISSSFDIVVHPSSRPNQHSAEKTLMRTLPKSSAQTPKVEFKDEETADKSCQQNIDMNDEDPPPVRHQRKHTQNDVTRKYSRKSRHDRNRRRESGDSSVMSEVSRWLEGYESSFGENKAEMDRNLAKCGRDCAAEVISRKSRRQRSKTCTTYQHRRSRSVDRLVEQFGTLYDVNNTVYGEFKTKLIQSNNKYYLLFNKNININCHIF